MAYTRLQQNFSEPRGNSSAVASVLFTRGGDRHEVTKSGSYIYHGDAGQFHEWEFRTRLRVKAAGNDEGRYAEAMSKVVDGLRGDAFIIAKEVGLDNIWEIGDDHYPAGVDTLIDAIKLSVFPLTTYEAKELFRQYCKPSGSLSRQNGESMHQYISRRRRCWKLLKELDPEIVLSEGHRADMLLDLAGLDKNERTMIQASIGNARDFEKIADALIVQHPRVHLRNASASQSSKGGRKSSGKGKGKGKSSKGKGKSRSWRNPSGFAYQAAEEWPDDTAYVAGENDFDEPYTDPAYWYGDEDWDEDADAYYAGEDVQQWEQPQQPEEADWAGAADDPLELAELECVACLFDFLGPDCLENPTSCSDFIQQGTAAFLATGGKGKKGGGKGKGKYPVRPSNLTIEDRRKKLRDLKSKTECKDCGRKGHWKGDRECTMNKTKTGFLAVQDDGGRPGFNTDDPHDWQDHVADMAVRSTPARPIPVTKMVSKEPMEWTFADGGGPPEGGNRKFETGVLKGRTFLDITLEHPEQYFSTRHSKTLSGVAKEYIAWVNEHFDRDPTDKMLVVKSSKSASKVDYSRASSSCSHAKVHHKGSSARYIRTTCTGCGEIWQEERNPPTTDPQVCSHARTDHRGSTKQVRKTFCIDCGTYIDSVAQSLAKDISSQPISIEEQGMLDRIGEHDTISREQIISAAELMLDESRRLEGGDYTLLSIGNMFIDCADRVLSVPAPRPAKKVPTAMVATATIGPTCLTMTRDDVCPSSKQALVAAVHEDKCTRKLRVVDPYTDPHVWAIVDDGCNSCTHSDAWMQNAREKWAKLGFTPFLRDSTSTNFTGVGSAPSTGKWKMPAAVKLVESGLVIPGAVDSHEIANSRHPLLLSQSVQAKLGFTKSVRKGTITMDDYEDQSLEVVRQAKTGLFMIRIDHLVAKQYDNFAPIHDMKGLLLGPSPTADTSSPSEGEEEDHGYVATKHRSKYLEAGKPFTPETLAADTLLVTCGVLNFEDSNYAKQTTKAFQDWNGDNKVTPGYLSRDADWSREGRAVFLDSFRANYPDLVRGRNVILIDCTCFTDPRQDTSLRRHLGTHKETYRNLVEADEFAKVNKPLKKLRTDQKNLVIDVCKSGRHRSVAQASCQATSIVDVLYRGDPTRSVVVQDLQCETHWEHLCPQGCPDCDSDSEENKLSKQIAFDMLKDIIPLGRLSDIRLAPRLAPVSRHTSDKATVASPAPNAKVASPAPLTKAVAAPSTKNKMACELVADHDDEISFRVIQKLLEVFSPSKGVFEMIGQYGGPAAVLEMLMDKHSVGADVILNMYKNEQDKASTRGSSSNASASTSKAAPIAARVKEEPKSRGSPSPVRKARSRSPHRGRSPPKEPIRPKSESKKRSCTRSPSRYQPRSRSRDASASVAHPEADSDASDESCEDSIPETPARPPGKKENEQRTDIPEKCGWGGPERGDDKDGTFLADERTGFAKNGDSPLPNIEDNKSPERAPKKARLDLEGCPFSGGRDFVPFDEGRGRQESSRTETPERGRSRSRRPRVVVKDKGKSKGKDKDKEGDKARDSSKGTSKEKSKETDKGKGKPKGRSKSKPVDDQDELSSEVREFHRYLVNTVDRSYEDEQTWKDEILRRIDLKHHEEERNYFCKQVFSHIKDLGKEKNKRIYIGPGRDGSSNDKISIDCKFNPQNTKVPFNKVWGQQGFRKTTYACFEDDDSQWKLIEDQADLKSEIHFGDSERPNKVAVMIHPPFEEATAFYAADFDHEEELDCFFCGESEGKSPCCSCGQVLCRDCIASVGCTCMLAADKYIAVDNFVPKPGQGKTTTFSKSQRKRVKQGSEAVARQDDAMWSTLTGKSNKISSLKKCLLAITTFSNIYANAIGQLTTFADPGWHGSHCDASMIDSLNKTVDYEDPSLIYIHVPFASDNENSNEYAKLKSFADDQIKAGRTCILADTRHTDRWTGVSPTFCRGDLAFYCNDKGICSELTEWAKERDNGNPRCTDDLGEAQFADVLAGLAESHHLDKLVDAAFAGTEEAAAEADPRIIDAIHGPEDKAFADPADVHDDEQDLLEKIPLPGNPQGEQERKKIWLSLPRRARITIRRLHRNFKHLPRNALVQMLRAAKAPKDFIEAAKSHRCDVCEATRPPARTNKVSRPKPYVFNHEIGVDVFEVKDAAGTFYDLLNVVDYGTTFQQAFIVREGQTNGVPSSSNCLDAFVKGWSRPFGWPKLLAADRGMHNRGVFGQTMSKKGVRINPAALESPEQIGRVERRNQTLKQMLNKVIKETNVIGRHQLDMALSECINALNELSRHGGFAPVQWVLAKFPRQPATMGDEDERHDIGAIQAHFDGPTEFALQSKYRLEAREAFIRWDCGSRIQRGYLRNAVPVPGPYKVGDIVSYCRRARAGEAAGIQWSVGSRIVGFETDPNFPDKEPSTAWVICDGLSVCVATDKIRPCTAAELLAYQFQQGNDIAKDPVSETAEQQSFIDERILPAKELRGAKRQKIAEAADLPEVESHSPGARSSTAAPAAPAVDAETEDFINEFMKELDSPDILPAEELRVPPSSSTNSAPLPNSSSKREASPSTLASHWKRNKVTGKGIELLEKTANLFDEEDQDRVGFLQVRLVPPKQKKTSARKPPKKKDGDKNLSFASCSVEVQQGLRKSRVKEWQKWKEFNAGVLLSKAEVQELVNEGVKVYPMQWIETDKNAHKRRDDAHIRPELKSRLVGCGNFEDTEGLRTDSPTGDVDAHNLVFSWCSSHKVKIKSADISSAYLQGKQNDRVILYRIPKGGIPEEGIEEGSVLAARVPIYGTKDAGRGFWLRLKEVATENGYILNKILPTMFSLRDNGKIVGVMSSNVDDLLYGSLPGYEQTINDLLDTFSVRERNDAPFRFCGKEVVQHDDLSITVTAKDNTEKIRPIDIGEKRRGTDKNTPEETTCLRSVVAALAWVARQVRPALSYRVSKLQSVAGKGFVKDMRECNKVLEYAQASSAEGIHFASSGITWDDSVVCSIADASFCNETVIINGVPEEGRSQQGWIVCLAPAGMVNLTEATIHPISWSSTHIKRVCRATLMAETFAMIRGTESGARIRAAIVDMRGELDFRNWEETAARAMGHVWLTDCDSLYEHLMSQRLNSIENKRLAIDLMALRQQIWERDGERTFEVDHSCGDYPRWIDTSVMIADPLTKSMNSDRLSQTFMTGHFDMRPTAESLMIKEKNRISRKAAKQSANSG